jgi:hypothetical protein
MNLVGLIFGERPRAARTMIVEAPAGVVWCSIRPKAVQLPVRAWRAEANRDIETRHGVLHARGGEDFIVDHGDGRGCAVVQPDIFEQTYEPLGGGLYRKRTDIALRYFTLDHPAAIQTLEGEQHAQAGDWIIEGVNGELWPVPPDKALEKYEPA